MTKIIVECTSCGQKNKVDSDKIQQARCSKCKTPFVKAPARNKGRIKFYNEEKGYGFIQDRDYQDYFFHITDVKSTAPLLKNALVEFDVKQEDRGAKAIDISVIKNHDGPVTAYSKPKFININNERILLSKIKKYTVHTHTLHYRNEKPIPKAPKSAKFFEKLFFSYDESELYSQHTFNYLKILMFDGSVYRIYSDSVARDVYKNKILGKGYRSLEYNESVFPKEELDNWHNKVVNSGLYMDRRDIEFSTEPISEIVGKLDTIFNSI